MTTDTQYEFTFGNEQCLLGKILSYTDDMNPSMQQEMLVLLTALTEEDQRNLINTIRHNRIEALIYFKVNKLSVLSPSNENLADFAAKLRKYYFYHLANDTQIQNQWKNILATLNKNNIPVIALKGIGLSNYLYPKSFFRTMSDIDILIPPDKFEQVLTLFQSSGYLISKITYHAVLNPPLKFQLPIEVHWKLLENREMPNSSDLDMIQFSQPWISAKSDDIKTMRLLIPEMEFLHLSSHIYFQHRSSYDLLWFYDIFLLLEKYKETFDWEKAIYLAFKLGWQESLRPILLTVSYIFGSVPSQQGLQTLPASLARSNQNGFENTETNRNRDLSNWMIHSWISLKWSERFMMIRYFLAPNPIYFNKYFGSKSRIEVMQQFFKRSLSIIKKSFNWFLGK